MAKRQRLDPLMHGRLTRRHVEELRRRRRALLKEAEERQDLFSMTNGWPRLFERRSANGRAALSVEPPGAKLTTMRTGFSGHSARAGVQWIKPNNAMAAGNACQFCMDNPPNREAFFAPSLASIAD